MSNKYIKDLTDQLISKNYLDTAWRQAPSEEEFFKFAKRDLLCGDVQNMRPETLGKIMCSFEHGSVPASKDEIFAAVAFGGDCDQLLRELVSACLTFVITARLNPRTPEISEDLPHYDHLRKPRAK